MKHKTWEAILIQGTSLTSPVNCSGEKTKVQSVWLWIFPDMQFEETHEEIPGTHIETQWTHSETQWTHSETYWNTVKLSETQDLGGNPDQKHIPECPPHTPPQAHIVFDNRRNSRRSPENYNRNPENHNRSPKNYYRSPENYCHTFKEFSNPENYCHTMKAQRIFHLHWVDLFHMKLFLS